MPEPCKDWQGLHGAQSLPGLNVLSITTTLRPKDLSFSVDYLLIPFVYNKAVSLYIAPPFPLLFCLFLPEGYLITDV